MRKPIFAFAALAALIAVPASAVAADQLPYRGPSPVYRTHASVANWSGLYFGAFAGYQWMSTTTTPDFGQGPVDADGFLGGLIVGVNHQFNQWFVAGLEFDFGTGSIRSARTELLCPAVFCGVDITSTDSSRLLFMSTARVRAGVLVRPTSLLYIAAGPALGRVELKNVTDFGTFGTSTFAQKFWTGGWTVGAGWEEARGPWRARIEYYYASLGLLDVTSSFSSPFFGSSGFSSMTRTEVHGLRAAILYQFSATN